VVTRAFVEPQQIVFAYDASPAAKRALERLAHSPLFAGLPVTIVMAESEGVAKRTLLDEAEAEFASDHQVTTLMDAGRAEQVIPQVVASTPHAMLLMGAYGHSPLRRMIIGSTTTAMIRTVKAPVLLVR
jgi:nucleotide-binding universal stress UspA family protein